MKKEFSEHKVTILTNTPDIQQFVYGEPGTNCYSFEVICTDHAIYVSGDLGELTVCPGYGRGLRWLRGSVNNLHYFHGKISGNIKYTKFDLQTAIEDIKSRMTCCPEFEEDRKYNKEMQLLIDEIYDFKPSDESELYSICNSYKAVIEEGYPDSRTSADRHNILYTGLCCFVAELDKIDFKIAELI